MIEAVALIILIVSSIVLGLSIAVTIDASTSMKRVIHTAVEIDEMISRIDRDLLYSKSQDPEERMLGLPPPGTKINTYV